MHVGITVLVLLTFHIQLKSLSIPKNAYNFNWCWGCDIRCVRGNQTLTIWAFQRCDDSSPRDQNRTSAWQALIFHNYFDIEIYKQIAKKQLKSKTEQNIPIALFRCAHWMPIELFLLRMRRNL